MKTVFLSAQWENLILANYRIDPELLQPWLPAGTEFDYWNGALYVSLVGFRFHDVRLKGLKIPFHHDFPEVNLRFYVKRKDGDQWKRGVVFIKEIVPLPAITFVANTVYCERYQTLPMRRIIDRMGDQWRCGYAWKTGNRWNQISVTSVPETIPIPAGSTAEFITQHFWGYAGRKGKPTAEYEVAHPLWEQYPVLSHQIDCDFEANYGPRFAFLNKAEPEHIHFAAGSTIEVYAKKLLAPEPLADLSAS